MIKRKIFYCGYHGDGYYCNARGYDECPTDEPHRGRCKRRTEDEDEARKMSKQFEDCLNDLVPIEVI